MRITETAKEEIATRIGELVKKRDYALAPFKGPYNQLPLDVYSHVLGLNQKIRDLEACS